MTVFNFSSHFCTLFVARHYSSSRDRTRSNELGKKDAVTLRESEPDKSVCTGPSEHSTSVAPESGPAPCQITQSTTALLSQNSSSMHMSVFYDF